MTYLPSFALTLVTHPEATPVLSSDRPPTCRPAAMLTRPWNPLQNFDGIYGQSSTKRDRILMDFLVFDPFPPLKFDGKWVVISCGYIHGSMRCNGIKTKPPTRSNNHRMWYVVWSSELWYRQHLLYWAQSQQWKSDMFSRKTILHNVMCALRWLR